MSSDINLKDWSVLRNINEKFEISYEKEKGQIIIGGNL